MGEQRMAVQNVCHPDEGRELLVDHVPQVDIIGWLFEQAAEPTAHKRHRTYIVMACLYGLYTSPRRTKGMAPVLGLMRSNNTDPTALIANTSAMRSGMPI